MITPPPDTKCNAIYSFKKDASQAFLKTILGSSSEDIVFCWIYVDDYATDFEAVADIKTAIDSLSNELSIVTTPQIVFNPIYLPHGEIEEDQYEVNEDGMVSEICGFKSPFTFMRHELVLGDEVLATGKVTYELFNLPSIEEILKADHVSLN